MVTNYYDGEKCYTNEENVNGTYEENKMENNDGDFSDSEYSPSNVSMQNVLNSSKHKIGIRSEISTQKLVYIHVSHTFSNKVGNSSKFDHFLTKLV